MVTGMMHRAWRVGVAGNEDYPHNAVVAGAKADRVVEFAE